MSAASVQSRIVDAVVAALNTAGAVLAPSVNAYRTRVEAFDDAEPRGYNVIPDEAERDPANSYSGVTAYKFRFCVRCSVQAQNEADAAADPLFVAAVAAIMADPTLGGLATVTRYNGQKWEKDGPAATDNVSLVVTFETEFSTARNDPSVPMP